MILNCAGDVDATPPTIVALDVVVCAPEAAAMETLVAVAFGAMAPKFKSVDFAILNGVTITALTFAVAFCPKAVPVIKASRIKVIFFMVSVIWVVSFKRSEDGLRRRILQKKSMRASEIR